MTHSLHRQGDEDSLQRDFVVLITPAAGINVEGATEKLKELVDVIEELGPDNIGDFMSGSIHDGHDFEKIKWGLEQAAVPRVRCCFSDPTKVIELLRYIKERDYGLSVTISGLINRVQEMCQQLQIEPHSINLSLGFHGRIDQVPEQNIMNIVTMCGHGMISAELVRDLIDRVSSGGMSPDEAAGELARPCLCGIFNRERARDLIVQATTDA